MASSPPRIGSTSNDAGSRWPTQQEPSEVLQNYGMKTRNEHEMDMIQHHDEATAAVSAAIEHGVSDSASTLVAVQQALRALENRRFV